VARIIAEAAVRLVVDRKGLGLSMRKALRSAIQDATKDSLFDAVTQDSETSARRIGNTWRRVLGGLQSAVRGVFGGVALTGKLLLLGTAAAGALAGISSLVTGTLALGQALAAASGAVGLLPAALLTMAAVSTTLKLGLSGMSDALAATGEDAATFEASLEGLAPNAQAFARAVREVRPAFDQMRLDVQNRLFEGLADRVGSLTERYLPRLQEFFVGIAGDLNGAANQLGDFLETTRATSQVQTIFDNIRSAIQQLVPATVPLSQAFLTISEVGSRFMPQLAVGFTNLAEKFSAFIENAAATGQLEEFFRNAIETIKQLGRIIGNVFGTLSNVMTAANSTGAGLLSTIERITQAMQDWTGSLQGQLALREFFASIGRIVDALLPPLQALIEVFMRDFVPILADIAEAIGPALTPIIQAFGRLLQALQPLIQAVAKAFGTMLRALEPVIDAFAVALNEAMPQLTPLIADIGVAFANLIESMAPLAPVFIDILEAVLQVIPPFIQMIADLMPRFIQILEESMPLIQAFADALVITIPIFTAIADFLLGVFIPVFGVLIDIISGLVDVTTWAANGIFSIVTTIFGAIGDFLSSVWTGISDMFSQIWDFISGVFEGGITGIAQKLGEFARRAYQWGKEAMINLGRSISEGVQNVVQFFIDLPGKIANAIIGIGRWLYQAGKDLLMGLVNGIKDAVMAVVNTVVDAVNTAIDTAKSVLGMNSPSRVFRDIGHGIGEGLVLGIADMSSSVATAAADMVDFASMSMAGPLSGNLALGGDSSAVVGAGAPAAPVVVNQTNVMQPGTDVKQFSDLILGRNMGDYWSGASTLTVARNGVQAGVNEIGRASCRERV